MGPHGPQGPMGPHGPHGPYGALWAYGAHGGLWHIEPTLTQKQKSLRFVAQGIERVDNVLYTLYRLWLYTCGI